MIKYIAALIIKTKGNAMSSKIGSLSNLTLQDKANSLLAGMCKENTAEAQTYTATAIDQLLKNTSFHRFFNSLGSTVTQSPFDINITEEEVVITDHNKIKHDLRFSNQSDPDKENLIETSKDLLKKINNLYRECLQNDKTPHTHSLSTPVLDPTRTSVIPTLSPNAELPVTSPTAQATRSEASRGSETQSLDRQTPTRKHLRDPHILGSQNNYPQNLGSRQSAYLPKQAFPLLSSSHTHVSIPVTQALSVGQQSCSQRISFGPSRGSRTLPLIKDDTRLLKSSPAATDPLIFRSTSYVSADLPSLAIPSLINRTPILTTTTCSEQSVIPKSIESPLNVSNPRDRQTLERASIAPSPRKPEQNPQTPTISRSLIEPSHLRIRTPLNKDSIPTPSPLPAIQTKTDPALFQQVPAAARSQHSFRAHISAIELFAVENLIRDLPDLTEQEITHELSFLTSKQLMAFQDLKMQEDINKKNRESTQDLLTNGSQTSPSVSFAPMYVRGRKKPLEHPLRPTHSRLEHMVPKISLRAATLQPPETRAQPTVKKPGLVERKTCSVHERKDPKVSELTAAQKLIRQREIEKELKKKERAGTKAQTMAIQRALKGSYTK